MNRHAALLAAAALLFGCGEAEREPTAQVQAPRSGSQATLQDWLPPGSAPARPSAPGHGSPHGGAPAAPPTGAPPASAPPGGGVVRGTVTETMDSGGYTYMNVETSEGLIWVATSQREITVGATVQAAGAMMVGFRSNTLNRTFDRLVLATRVDVVPAG